MGGILNVSVFNAVGAIKEVDVPVSAYSWAANQWIQMRVTWDFAAAAGVQSTHIYLNGIEPSYGFNTLKGPLTMPQESATQYLYIGNRSTNTPHANGIIDEFVVYDAPVAPAPDTTPPAVSVTFPTGGATVGGSVTINANASDNVGVARVEFYRDGTLLGTDTSVPYQQIWNTVLDANGAHSLSAVAYDASNNSATSAIVPVTVNNAPGQQPLDIILVLTDDQRWDTVQYMPLTNALLGPESMKFENAFSATALCCPSRSTILTGLYTHNHGVRRNWVNEGGGTPAFPDSSTIATWLDAAGYRTGIYGKYLNDYNKKQPYPYTAPGWDEWHVIVEEATKAFYNYTMAENGTLVSYGSAPQDYSTSVIAQKAVSFIETTPANQPLFLYFTPVAPHAPGTPAPQDVGTYASLAPWRPPSYNEADVSDKQSWPSTSPLLTATQQASGDALRITQIESLQAVDRAVRDIVDALIRTNRYQNAAVIFMSDSGLLWGEHRRIDSKECAYEECIRYPLWVRVPGVTASSTDTHLISNIDIAPTVAEIAGVPPSTSVNGQSFVSLLTNPSAPWRTEILLENLAVFPIGTFDAIRTSQYKYADYYAIGGREFYDLAIDPYELDNRVNDPAYSSIIQQLQNLLATLKNS